MPIATYPRSISVSDEARAYTEQRKSAEFDRANELHELATDVTERIGYNMNHLVEYEMIDGQAWCVTAKSPMPMVKITEDALVDGRSKYFGENQFQMERMQLEHEEAQLVDSFFRGELKGNVLSVVSLIPDAVRNGTASIEGYRRDLMRSLTRIYYVTDDGKCRCRLFSIDQTDRDAMRVVGNILGIEIGVNDPSEVVLGRRSLMNMSSVTDEDVAALAERVIDENDAVLLKKTGKLTRAGSKFLDRRDALAVVKLHGQLLEECRQNIGIINASGLSANDKRVRIEAQMKRTTGAINAAIDGHDVSSSGDAVAAHYVENNNYDNDCPTGPSQLEQAMSQQLDLKGIGDRLMLKSHYDPCMTCPRCKNKGVDVMVHGQDTFYTCKNGCGASTLPETLKPKEKTPEQKSSEVKNQPELRLKEFLKSFGHGAVLKTTVIVGDARRDVVARDGTILKENVTQADLALAA